MVVKIQTQSSNMIPKLLNGFDEDLKKILIDFEKESNVDFSIFSNIWKKYKFTLIFSGRSPKEIVHFTNEALAYTKSFFLRSNSFLRKICCIYVMYGLYYKQPIKNSSKINVTYEEWIILKEFINILKINKHTEPLYILSRLIFDNAFQFTSLNTKRLTPIPNTRINYDTAIIDDEMGAEQLKIDHLLVQLASIENVYGKAKTSLTEKLNMPEIKYSNDNISEVLKNILKHEAVKHEDEKPGTSQENEVLRKRQSIKQKGFRSKEKRGFLDRLNVKGRESSNEED